MKNKERLIDAIIILVLLVIIIMIVSNPATSIKSAKKGLDLWFNLLLPSLLPFLFISSLLVSTGFIDFLGKYLQPIMKPLFNVSGVGIFPFAMSIMSGYPVGAKLTSNLRKKKSISKTMGNRLISFSSTSGPLFILGTVAIGMLALPGLGLLFLLPHYLGSITLGLIFRFYRTKDPESDISIRMYENRPKDKKPIGFLMTKCIKDSMDSMFIIGGFVIIYSVIIDLLLLSNIFNSIITRLSLITKVDINTLRGLTAGIIELTNGCKIVASLDISLISKIIIINFLIGWGGFSIHSQAISFISSTDLSVKIYLFSKFLHGVLASLYTYIMYIFLYKDKISSAFNRAPITLEMPTIKSWLYLLTSSTKIAISLIVFLILLSIFINEIKVKRI